MAIIKSKPAKSSLYGLGKIIDYIFNIEKTDEKIIGCLNCLPENAYYTMKATKELYDKVDGRSYYHFMQSFKPGELDAKLAHSIGKELMEKEFTGFEVAFATHVDKLHIHNHFVLNSVSFVDGHKFVSSREKLREIKDKSNRMCEREGLSVIKEPYAHGRYTMTEYKLAEKGMPIWKEQLRAAIDESKLNLGASGDLDKVEMEDEHVVQNVQKGISSSFYNTGRFSPTKEKGVHHFHNLISDFINTQ